MNNKFTPEQAIKFLRQRDKVGNSNIRIMHVESLEEIAALIESLAADAELGMAAAEAVESGAYLAINIYRSCHPEADAYTECQLGTDCVWNKFCRLRAMKGGE